MLLDGGADLSVGGPIYTNGDLGACPPGNILNVYTLKSVLVHSETNIINT